MKLLVDASPDQQRRVIETMPPFEMLKFDADFETWAHANQLPPNEDGWRVWMMLAGRGFGKTRAGAEWICRLAAGKPKLRIALVGATIAEGRSIMVEGVSGVLRIAKAHRRRVSWEPSLSKLTWPNGSEAQLFSGDKADGLRGPEHDFAWCAAASGHAGRRRGRGAATLGAAGQSGRGCLLYHWRGRQRRVERPTGTDRRI